MASSRWKRFAFFERQTLTVPPDVLEDLIPAIDGSSKASLRTLHLAASSQESVSLTVSTAALPLDTKPARTTLLHNSNKKATTTASKNDESQPAAGSTEDSVSLMWSSLTACTSPELSGTVSSEKQQGGSSSSNTNKKAATTASSSSVKLLSQGQASLPSSPSFSSSTTTTTVLDGLVLAFASSKDSARVHCFDLTVRCNPPSQKQQHQASTTSMEDMDGWRGYWNPFVAVSSREGAGTLSTPATALSAAATAPPPQPSSSSMTTIGVVHTAACRIPAQGRRRHQHSALHVACLGPSTPTHHQIAVWEDPHLHLSCRKPLTTVSAPNTTNKDDYVVYTTTLSSSSAAAAGTAQSQTSWNASNDGNAVVVGIVPGLVAVGTDAGVVLVYAYNNKSSSSNNKSGSSSSNAKRALLLRPYVRIPPPPVPGVRVVSVQLATVPLDHKAHVFVAYNREQPQPQPAVQQQGTAPSSSNENAASAPTTSAASAANNNSSMNTAGICCYDVPLPNMASPLTALSAPSARHDLDGRYVGSSSLVDSSSSNQYGSKDQQQAAAVLKVTVARPDGLYSYSQTERTGVAPIDGTKLAICLIPPPVPAEKAREVDLDQVGSGYVLVASTDAKSGRDAVDIYDTTNKLVAFHLLLSPGHRAVQASGVTTLPTIYPDGSVRGGRSSAIVLTSGGSLVTFTEKLTEEKISLLTQKNLYSAAVVVAYADPSYDASVITTLYQQYAEYLYRKGDFSGAIDQYMHTIGSLESSHVIFRYLDAPKIPLLVKYLEKLRSRELATPVHNELLRTCYLKLNDIEAAESIAVAATSSVNDASLESILSNLSNKPKDALATICSLEAHQAAEVLVIHGASLARALPRETAGVVISLCVGTYTPKALADCSIADTLGAAAATTTAASLGLNKMINSHENPKAVVITPYPIHLFASAFVEHPKILRLLLAHCNRNKCPLPPSLRRTLLELTLAEWNHAKRSGDTEAEKLRHKEAIASLTDSHCRDIGDYDALVIVQLAGFEEGELLLYERLQMTPMLLERYAKDGSEKSRRQMLAICQTDPEVLADVLGHFVELASEKLNTNAGGSKHDIRDDDSEDDEVAEIMDDIQEALALARRQGVLPPVRIARILAGEGTGQFSADRPPKERKKTVPLSVALDYVGTILEESRRETSRLKSEIEEYNELCNSMENEIDSLLRASYVLPPTSSDETLDNRFNIDELYTKVKTDEIEGMSAAGMSEQAREAFWREMNQTEDSFDTISRFFAKDVIR